MSKSKVKCMFVCFFDSMGIVHKERVAAAQTVNQYYYTEILERLRNRVMRVRPNSAKTGSSRQCDSPCSALCSAVSDIQMHYGDAAVSILN